MYKKTLGLVMGAILFICGCSRELWSYDAPVTISFDGIDESGIHSLRSGETQYRLSGSVTSKRGISIVEIYNADCKTSLEYGSALVKELYDANTTSAEFSCTLSDIDKNSALKVVVTASDGKIFKKGVVLKIVPHVIFTEDGKVESYDYLYGSFFADWYDGRTYTMRNAGEFAAAIDISAGEIEGVFSFISPAYRDDVGLTVYPDAKDTKFRLSDLTKSDFDAVTRIDAEPFERVEAMQNHVPIEEGKVYECRMQDGRKGLIHVESISSRKDINFPEKEIYTATISTKITVK